MTGGLVVERTGPAVSIQDLGRPGWLKSGLSRGGAADRSAFIEGLALLDLSLGAAGIEMAELGGRFRFQVPMRFALTGAVMKATLDGERLDVGASHFAAAGAVLDVGAAERGVYAYLHVAGGIAAPVVTEGEGSTGSGGLGGCCGRATCFPSRLIPCRIRRRHGWNARPEPVRSGSCRARKPACSTATC